MLLTTLLTLRQRAIVQVFEQAGAVSADSARSIEQLGLRVSPAWQQLASYAVLRSPAKGRWFLDKPNWRLLLRRRGQWAGGAVALVLVLCLIVWAMHY